MTGKILRIGYAAIFSAALATQVSAGGPGVALVGSPCFCAQVCAALGATYSVWTDPAGAKVNLSSCPPAERDTMWRHGRLCSCYDPLDWYRLQNELRPSVPEPDPGAPVYKGP